MSLALLDAIGEDRLRIGGDLIGGDEEAATHEERLEGARELAGSAEALAAVLRERLHHDLFEVDRIPANEGGRARDVALLHLGERVEVALHAEQPLSGGELPEHDAEREDVGAAVDAFAVHLLRRHVRELPLEGAGARVAHARAELRDPEVDDLRDAVVRDEEVVGGDVAVDEIELLAVFAEQLVRGVQAFGGVGDDTAGDLGRHRRAELLGPPHHLAERLAVEVLHCDPVRVLVLAEVEHRRDVGMRDARGDARLVEEHLDERLVLDEMRVDLLDRDPLLEAAGAIHACEVHAGHAAYPDLVDDAVATEEVGPAAADVGHRARRSHWRRTTVVARGTRAHVRTVCTILRQVVLLFQIRIWILAPITARGPRPVRPKRSA